MKLSFTWTIMLMNTNYVANAAKEIVESELIFRWDQLDLEKTMTDEQKEIFQKFHDWWDEYVTLSEAAIFEYAFKLGMQIAIETLTE